MQMYFLKSMAGVSIAALLFSTIGMKILAEQAPATISEDSKPKIAASQDAQSVEVDIPNKTAEPVESMTSDQSNSEPTQSKPNVMLSEDERTIVRNLLKEEADAERSSEEKQAETLETIILDSPEKRSADRVTALGEMDDDSTEWRYEDYPEDSTNLEGAEPVLPKEDEIAPPVPETNGANGALEAEVETNETIVETPQREAAPAPQVEPVPVPQAEAAPAPQADVQPVEPGIPLTEEAPTLVPQDEQPPLAQQEELPVVQRQNNLSDRIISPSLVGTRPVVIRPNVNAKPIIYGGDDDEDAGPKKEEDPDDPTSEGTRKHGRHKGIQVAKPKVIPIIRMGQDQKEHSGLTVIKPWNS